MSETVQTIIALIVGLPLMGAIIIVFVLVGAAALFAARHEDDYLE